VYGACAEVLYVEEQLTTRALALRRRLSVRAATPSAGLAQGLEMTS
jgi:hypothetical protein